MSGSLSLLLRWQETALRGLQHHQPGLLLPRCGQQARPLHRAFQTGPQTMLETWKSHFPQVNHCGKSLEHRKFARQWWWWRTPLTPGDREAGTSLSSRPAWPTGWVPGQAGLHRETMSRKKEKRKKVTLSILSLGLVCVSENCSCLSFSSYVYYLTNFLQLQLESFP